MGGLFISFNQSTLYVSSIIWISCKMVSLPTNPQIIYGLTQQNSIQNRKNVLMEDFQK
jgi:hypothetical protein